MYSEIERKTTFGRYSSLHFLSESMNTLFNTYYKTCPRLIIFVSYWASMNDRETKLQTFLVAQSWIQASICVE